MAWDQKLIEGQKAHVKQDLDAQTDPKNAHSRLDAIFARLDALAGDDSDVGRLRRYIYAVSALVHHERVGGLSAKDVGHLIELAYAILQAQGVRPRASRLASLYGDIHLIKSQIDRKSGLPWRAAWEQQVALQLAGEFPSGGLGFQLLGMGNRALRLGHAALATQRFHQAEDAGLSGHALARCRLGLVHAAWLSGRREETEAIVARALAEAELPEDIRAELVWNAHVRKFQETGELAPILSLVRSGGEFYDATYVIETCMWGLTTESRAWLDRTPRLGSMRRNKKLLPQRLGIWYETGVRLQEAYDHGVPLPFRLRALSQSLEQRDELLTVDKDLLLLAAATRWLARSKSHALARLVYDEYRALSHRLSDGKVDDVLGCLRDLTSRGWMEPAEGDDAA